jgi:hypothetical protein
VESKQNLENDSLRVFNIEETISTKNLFDVRREIVKYQAHIFWVISINNNFPQIDDIGMLEFSQQKDFPKDSQRLVFVLKEIFDFLDGYFFSSVDVDSRINSRRHSVADFFINGIVRNHGLVRLSSIFGSLENVLAFLFGIGPSRRVHVS